MKEDYNKMLLQKYLNAKNLPILNSTATQRADWEVFSIVHLKEDTLI